MKLGIIISVCRISSSVLLSTETARDPGGGEKEEGEGRRGGQSAGRQACHGGLM